MKHALILFAHGARDPRWAAPFERLRELAQSALPGTVVSLAFLELMSPRLPEAVASLVQDGCGKVSLVPVFLGQGGHVLRDLPLLVDELRNTHPGLDITVAPAVGEDAAVLDAIARYCVSTVEGA
ncbi:MAG: cobalamin biosynthesis protein CbiX [Oxalobacteraceae bacterium]|nr:MAG: cobalamin biosynthesis protein CbiX [Oxalobacteraceae bacterium]